MLVELICVAFGERLFPVAVQAVSIRWLALATHKSTFLFELRDREETGNESFALRHREC
jgi:hypothetical protein